MRYGYRQFLLRSASSLSGPSLSALTLAAASIVENSAGGTVVGGVLGKTSGSTLTLADSAGSRFALSGTNIVAGSVATDYEAATSHSITIRETLAGYANSPRDTVLTITVANVFEQPSLSALTLSSTSFTVGAAASGAITGATAGSTITASGLPTGLTINGAARTWAYDGTGSAGTSTITLTVAAGDTIRLTIAAGAANRTVFPLLHKLPASGPWDAHVVFGASREAYAFGSKLMEDAIIADDATRDPIVFNYAVAGRVVSAVATNAATAAPIYAGTARYALLGSIIGNNVSANRPYTSGQKAALDASIASIASSLSGYTLGFANTSYRSYTSAPAVASGLGGVPTAPENGSAPYNDAVIGPAISTYAPACYDSSLQRSRIDDYLAILYNRGSLTDEVHGAEAAERALWVATWFNYVRTGNWGTSQIEQRVAGAEATASTKASALTNYNEAVYAMAALAATSAKTALQARLNAIYPTVLFYEAVRLIDVAVASQGSADKTTAQSALNAASAAGYSGSTSPNTIADQQARINGIVPNVIDQLIQIQFGSGAAGGTGWNVIPKAAEGTSYALVDSTGAATGLTLTITQMNSGAIEGVGVGSTGSNIAEFPDPHLNSTILTSTGSGHIFTISGANAAKLYDVVGASYRTATRVSRLIVNGTSVDQPEPSTSNQSSFRLLNVAPNGSNALVVQFGKATGSSYAYASGLVLKRHNP